MNKFEKQFEKAAGDLAIELANVHGTLFLLITALSETELSPYQRNLIEAARVDLRQSQGKFFATFGDEIGGLDPQRN